jgi:hypothetical protein
MRRCNHCNGQLGLIVHRKWMLRFCSKSCKKAYEHISCRRSTALSFDTSHSLLPGHYAPSRKMSGS